jgi:hypothetical protein
VKLRSVIVGVAVLGLLLAGAMLLREGLRAGPPQATPTPGTAVHMDVEEARRIAASGRDVRPLAVPDGTDLGPYVRLRPVPEPPGEGASPWRDRLQVPSLYIDAPLEDHGVTAQGAMSLPQHLSRVGRLATTQPLGTTHGATLLAGHVTWNGDAAALYYLGEARPGAAVRTWDGDGRREDWVVTAVEVLDKQALPPHLFTKDGPRRLVLVTCGGELAQLPDGSWTYESNIVVTAVPVTPDARTR